MRDAYIIDAHHLEVVPDGTIITWRRILGDRTSEAVAFVRREVEPTRPGVRPAIVVWISPGGWDPQTIESAGVTFPATVVRWGDVSEELIRATDVPALVETLDQGGAYQRASALDAAARVYQGTALGVVYDMRQSVTDLAEGFEEWLNRPVPVALKGCVELPDYESPEFEAQADAAVAAYRSWEANEGNAEGLPTDILRGDQ